MNTISATGAARTSVFRICRQSHILNLVTARPCVRSVETSHANRKEVDRINTTVTEVLLRTCVVVYV